MGSIPSSQKGWFLHLRLQTLSPERLIRRVTIQEKGDSWRGGVAGQEHQCFSFRVHEGGSSPNNPHHSLHYS